MTTVSPASTANPAPGGELSRVYVSGHKNPDTDSIAAAIGYAEFKSRVDPGTEYVPVRLGELNPQTTWALERAAAESPVFLPHIRLRASDVMRDDFPVAHMDDPVRIAGQFMADAGLDLLPVVDDDQALIGVLTERVLARRYVRASTKVSKLEADTSPATMAAVLDGELLVDGGQAVAGRVWVLAMDVASLLRDVSEGDVAVVGDRPDAQRRAIELGVRVLVLSNSSEVGDDVLAFAREHGASVISTPLDSYVAGRMITLSSPCKAYVETEPLTVQMNDLVDDITEDIKDIHYRAAVVVDGGQIPVGLVTRTDLVSPKRRRVILVDHAERAQSVPGVEHAEIVEILDHHHIGSIETRTPVTATFDPVGSTSTLIIERFRAAGLTPSRPAAIMLLSAILSDTVILNSPTTTDRDRAVIEHLGEELDLDPIAFGQEMFQANSDVSDASAEDLVHRDAKSYELADGQRLCIAQIETVGDAVLRRAGELREVAADMCVREGFRLYALMITDVVGKGTKLLVAGDVAYAERAFEAGAVDGVIDLPGVMSRKKQVAPPLLSA